MKLTEKLLNNLDFYLLIIALLAGQLVKIPLGLGGITLLDLLVLAFCLVGIVLARFKMVKPPQTITAGLFFTLIALISLIASPLNLNFNEYLSSAFYLIRFFLYLLFGYLIYANIFPNLKIKAHELLIYSGLGLAILGLLQLIFFPDLSFLTKFGWDPHYFRTVSTFLDPNFLGAFLVLTLLLMNQQKLQLRWPMILMAPVFIALLTTFSRSSYLMFFISFMALSWFTHSKRLALITLIAFSTLITSFYIYTQIVSKPHGVNRDSSASFRLGTWQQGLTLFEKYPIIGVGFNTYKFGLEQNGLADQQFLNSHGATSNDSSLLFVLATTGLIGFTFYCYFLFRLFISSGLILKSAILGLLVHSFFANSLFYPFILLWLLLVSSKTIKNSVK